MDDSVIGLFLLIFCTSIAGLILWKLFDITRNSIKKNRSSYDENRFDKLAKAFIQQRKKTDKRLENIEAILSEEKATYRSLNQPENAQTIESPDFRNNRQQNNSGSKNKQRSS